MQQLGPIARPHLEHYLELQPLRFPCSAALSNKGSNSLIGTNRPVPAVRRIPWTWGSLWKGAWMGLVLQWLQGIHLCASTTPCFCRLCQSWD